MTSAPSTLLEASVALPEHSKLPRNANQREVMCYAEAYAREHEANVRAAAQTEEVARLADKLKTWIDLNVGRAAEATILSEDVNRLAALAQSPTVASPALVAEVGDDTKRLDFLQSWADKSVAQGFKWDNYVFTNDTPIREQLDAALAASPALSRAEKAA